MSVFSEAFPHAPSVPRAVTTERAGVLTTPTAAVIKLMRRQQLVDLAYAHNIDAPQDATRADILPVLIAAEASGRFTRPPIRPEFLAKALMNSDEAKLRPVDWQSYATPAPEVPGLETVDFRGLQRLAKLAGINSFGLSADTLRKALTEKAAA